MSDAVHAAQPGLAEALPIRSVVLDTAPCMSLPSTWNTLRNSHAPVAARQR